MLGTSSQHEWSLSRVSGTADLGFELLQHGKRPVGLILSNQLGVEVTRGTPLLELGADPRIAFNALLLLLTPKYFPLSFATLLRLGGT